MINKKCTRCNLTKEQTDYYMCSGKYRSECKACTIKKNVRYQKKVRAWRFRFTDIEERKIYMRKYYEDHKENFVLYREKFKKKYPEYYKHYFRNRKNKNEPDDSGSLNQQHGD